MPHFDENPPSIVKQNESLAEEISKIRNAYHQHVRRTLDDAHEIGKLLVGLKERTIREQQEWFPVLAKTDINERTAQKYMRIAENWTKIVSNPSFSTSTGVDESLILIAEPITQTGNPQAHATKTNIPTRPIMTNGESLCSACTRKQRVGQPVPTRCPDCAALKKAKQPRMTEPPPDAGDAWEPEDEAIEDVQSNGLATILTNAIREIAKDDIQDEVGHKIPEHLQPTFDLVGTFETIDSHLRAVQGLIDHASKSPGGELLRQDLQPTGSEDKTINKSQHLNALKRDLRQRPYSVCPYCEGSQEAHCKGCSGRGWVTKFSWNSIDDHIKARIACSS